MTEVLRSDFSGLKTSAASMTSVTSTASMASMTSTASFFQKITHPEDLIIPGTKMTDSGPFLDHQKSFFLLILASFLWEEAVEAGQFYFFDN